MNPPLQLLATLQSELGTMPADLLPVPGRDLWVAGLVEEKHQYCIVAPDLDGKTTFDNRSARSKQTTLNRPLPRWARYIGAATVALEEMAFPTVGCHIVIAGMETIGPRYEFALGMAFVAWMYHHHKLPFDQQLLLDVMDRAPRDYASK